MSRFAFVDREKAPAKAVTVGKASLTRRERVQEVLNQAGLSGVTPTALFASSAGLAILVATLVFIISLSYGMAIVFGLLAAYAPAGLVRYRQRKRRQELRDLWPDVVDNLASGVRAGMSLPEALTQLGVCADLRRCVQPFNASVRTIAPPVGSTRASIGSRRSLPTLLQIASWSRFEWHAR